MESISQEKVIVKVTPESYPTERDIANLICYVWRLSMEAPWGAFGVYPLTVEEASRAFLYVQRWHGKLDGRRMFHLIVSFPQRISMSAVYETSKRISETIGSGYQNVWGIHTDKNNLHVHFAINATNYVNGRKITEEELFKHLKIAI